MPPYANDDKLTFDPFEWPGENLGFPIVHSNTYASISSFCAKTIRSKLNLSSLVNGSANSEKVYCSDSLPVFFIDNKKSIQKLIYRHKIGMMAVNIRYITTIDS